MKPLRRTGNSANLTYYAEPGALRGDIWAEVLRSDLDFTTAPATRRKRPRFHVTIYRRGTGEVARTRYYPRQQMPPGPLAAKKVTELVREALVEKR